MDENDKSPVIVEAVPDELRDRLAVAIRVCPRQAISMEQDA